MPKISQIVIVEGDGRARRLMARAKKKSPRAMYHYDKNVYDYSLYGSGCGGWVRKISQTRIDGCVRGTKKVPKDNAMKCKKTGELQVQEVLVQMGTDLAAIPPSEVEFYWQQGTMSAGGRFKPLPDPAPARPKP